MKKLVRESLNFQEESDPIKDMGIGLSAIDYSDDPKIVNTLFKKRKPGHYLMRVKDNKYFLYSKDDDKIFNYLVKKYGEWNDRNADKYSKYIVTEIFKDGGEEDYTAINSLTIF